MEQKHFISQLLQKTFVKLNVQNIQHLQQNLVGAKFQALPDIKFIGMILKSISILLTKPQVQPAVQ